MVVFTKKFINATKTLVSASLVTGGAFAVGAVGVTGFYGATKGARMLMPNSIIERPLNNNPSNNRKDR